MCRTEITEGIKVHKQKQGQANKIYGWKVYSAIINWSKFHIKWFVHCGDECKRDNNCKSSTKVS